MKRVNQSTITKRKIILIILSALVSIAIIGTEIHSPILTIGITIIIAFSTYYALNYRNTFWHFIFILPFIPPYLAYQVSSSLPVVTAFRFLLILFAFDQLIIKKRFNLFLTTVKNDRFTIPITLYSIGIMIPGLYYLFFEFNKTAFVGSLSTIIEGVFLYYLVLMNFNIYLSKDNKYFQKSLSIFCYASFALAFLGIIEYLTYFNIFHLLNISNVAVITANSYIRQDQLRVSSSFSHALGYGLYLLLFIPIAYYKYKYCHHKNIYRLGLLLLIINLLMTISRSTILAFMTAIFIYFLFSNLKKKIIFIYSVVFIAIPIILLSLAPGANSIPGLSTVSNNVEGISDTFFGTHLSQNYGHNIQPFSYRNQLIDFAFSQQGTENILGKGVGFIRTEPLVFYLPDVNPYGPTISNSVDNYYMNVKLESGWFGLISTVLLFVLIMVTVFKYWNKILFSKIIFISFCGYMIGLFMVNDLDTIQFLWILLALFSAHLNVTKKIESVNN